MINKYNWCKLNIKQSLVCSVNCTLSILLITLYVFINLYVSICLIFEKMFEMALIDELLKEKDSLIKRINAIDLLLEYYGAEESSSIKFNSDTALGKVSENSAILGKKMSDFMNFPIHGRKDKQVLWIFEHKAKVGIKLSEIQEFYNDLRGLDGKGKEIRIDNVARRLKRQGKLVIVKYNNLNKASFWGLPEWVDKAGFKDELKPAEDKLPIDVHTIEVLSGAEVK